MEELIKNDATFEVYHNSEGGQLLDNRVLLSYPSEKSSFDVFLGADGYSNFNTDDTTSTEKPKVDAEKVAQGITAGATALSSVVGTVQAFKGDGTKAPSRRKQLKEVCGRKPLFGKEKKGYNDCVKQYNAGKIGGVNTKSSDNSGNDTPPPPPPIEPTNNTTRNIIIGVVVLALGVTAFIGFKKGWFGKKAV
jgi:hypothetical protein